MTTPPVAIALSLALVTGCATAPESSSERENLVSQSRAAMNQMTVDHPDLDRLATSAYGYAIFPSVGAGGFLVGAAHGQGVVYQGGALIGYASISSVSAGAEAGGESYDELILFEDKGALDRMIDNNLSLTANASVVVLKPGAAAAAQFQRGIAVFVKPTGGAMVNVSVGGQSFSYVPASNVSGRR